MTATNTANAALAEFSPRRLYDVYSVRIRIREALHGGKPKDPALLESHIKRKTGFEDEATRKLIEQAEEGAPEPAPGDLDVTIEKSASRFLSDERGLYVETFQIKAMLRQSGSMLGLYKKKRGSKQVCAEGLEVRGLEHERRVYLGKSEPDGTREATVHAMTPKGPISGIKHTDYVGPVELAFEVWILKTAAAETRHVGKDDLVEILTFGQENGIGADRSQGFGKFDVIGFSKA
jgi:hypothetical protein